MRILVGPVEISGIASTLVSSFRALGVQADVVLALNHQFSYGQTKSSMLLNLWRRLGEARFNCSRYSFIKKTFIVVAHRFVGWLCFLWSLARYDVYLFTFGCTFTNTWLELALTKVFRKRVFFVYFGSESRPSFLDGTQLPATLGRKELSRLYSLSRKCRARVRRQERFAECIINSPAAAHYHTRPFINWFALGVPVNAVEVKSSLDSPPSRGKPVRILHSPSNPLVKGTQVIEDAVNALVNKGYSIEFVKLAGVSNAVVLEELQRCDFVVDQVFSDTPMAVFAAEAAKLGKPAVVAGYFSEVVSDYFPDDEMPPVLFVSPDKLESAIERLIVDGAYREELGSSARKFLNDQWHPVRVAERYLSVIRGDFPKEWCVNPYSVSYVWGGGVSKERLKAALTKYVDAFGPEALGFDDKPLLEKKILQIVNGA